MLRARALVIAGVMCWAAAFAQNDEGDEHFARAIRLHQAGDIQGAIAEYQQCLKLEPEKVDAISNLGAALARLGRYPEAIEQYRHALTLSPQDPRIRLNLALAYYKSDMLAEAIRELSSLHESAAGNEQILILLSDCYFRLGENRKVVELLRPVAASGADNRAILYLLGTALIRDNQIVEGQALIEQLLRQGESAETQLLIGTTQLMGGQYAEAEKTLARAVSLNPELPDVFAYYAMALMKAGDAEAAAKAFHRELARDPGSYLANLNLGCLLRDQGKLDEAMPLLRRAREMRPRAAEAQIELGKTYLAANRWPEAAAELESAARENPESIEVHRALADVYERMKRPADRDAQRTMAQRLEAQDQSNPAIEKLHKQIMEKLKAEAAKSRR
jgi:protein O-GlcNAc transferase